MERTGELSISTALNANPSVVTTLTGAVSNVSATFDNSEFTVETSISDTTAVTITGTTTLTVTAEDLPSYVSDPNLRTQTLVDGIITLSGNGFNAGNVIRIPEATLVSKGFTGAGGDLVLVIENDNLNQISPTSVIMMSSSLGNETYAKNYIPADLTYNPGANVRFPGGLEPADTAFPKYDLVWEIQPGDEIRFENNEDYTYKVQKVVDPSQAQGSLYSKSAADDPEGNGYDVTGQLQVYLDREVIPSIDKDYFLIRRFIPSPTVIYINKLFPYGSLPSKKEFIPSQNSITLNAPTGSAGTVATGSTTTTTTSGSIVSVYNPLLKSDNLPSAFLFPEYPTAEIELNPDKALQDLRDKKLIE